MKLRAIYPLKALVCLLVFVSTLVAQRKPTPPTPPPSIESNEKAWQTFISSEGKFAVLFPGSPEKSGQVIKTGVGSLPSFSFTLKTGMAEYLISYMDFPSDFDDPAILKAAYDGGRDETLSSNRLTLVGERDFTVDSYKGRHITAEARGELVNVRIIAVDKRLYQLMIVTKDYRQNPPAIVKSFERTINRFLDSFKLIISVKGGDPPVAETSSEVGPVDLGRIESSVYINDYFSFRVSLPETWHVLERDTNDAALQVSKEITKGPDKKTNAEFDQSIRKTFLFFTVTKFRLRTPNVKQAMLLCGVERLSDIRITGRNYLEKNRDFLLSSPDRYKLLRDVYPETIAGQSFFVMDMQQSAVGVTVKQKYYSTIRKGLALFFVTNYFTEVDRIALEKIVQGTQFQ